MSDRQALQATVGRSGRTLACGPSTLRAGPAVALMLGVWSNVGNGEAETGFYHLTSTLAQRHHVSRPPASLRL